MTSQNSSYSLQLAMLTLLLLLFPLASGLPRLLFLPFGEEHGDQITQYNQCELISEFPALYAHGNGVISDRAMINDPASFPLNYTVIAPLWTNFTSVGNISYRRLTNPIDQSSQGFIEHLVLAAGQQLLDINTVIVVTWNDMKCICNNTEKKYTFQCVIARNDEAAVVLFLFSVSEMDILVPNNETDSCINPVVGYNIPNQNSSSFANTLQDITEESNVNISGLWIFPISLPPIPTTSTLSTRRPNIDQLNLPNWALSLWNIGQSIITYAAGVGTAVLATCCLKKYKQRKRNKAAVADNDPLSASEKQTDQTLSPFSSEKIGCEESSIHLQNETYAVTDGSKIKSSCNKTHSEDNHLILNSEIGVVIEEEDDKQDHEEEKRQDQDEVDCNYGENREMIELLAALTPQQSKTGKSYSLPVDPRRTVMQSDAVSSASQGRSMSLQVPRQERSRSQSPSRISMLVVRSPARVMRERTLSWMDVNGDDDENTKPQIITSTASAYSSSNNIAHS